MNSLLIPILFAFTAAAVLNLILIPVWRYVGAKVNLIDKPNERKVHTTNIPLVGGIAICSSVALVLPLLINISELPHAITKLLTASFILLLVGIIDDKMEVSAWKKIIIQVICAGILINAGLKVTSFYGILGVYELHIYVQYILSGIIIIGTVNANNLMDGIDGLAGGLSLAGFFILGSISAILGQYEVVALCATLVGAITSFLYFNLNQKAKIFMGDAGSLFLGLMQIGLAIYLINVGHTNIISGMTPWLLPAIISVFFIPVIDSLRVYAFRIKKGYSPFSPDKSHIHHLFLNLEFKHIKATIMIVSLSLFITFSTIFLQNYLTIIGLLIVSYSILRVVYMLLSINEDVNKWQFKIKQIEG